MLRPSSDLICHIEYKYDLPFIYLFTGILEFFHPMKKITYGRDDSDQRIVHMHPSLVQLNSHSERTKAPMAKYDHFPGAKEVSLRSYEYLRYHIPGLRFTTRIDPYGCRKFPRSLFCRSQGVGLSITSTTIRNTYMIKENMTI